MNPETYLDKVLHDYGHRVFSINNAPANAICIGKGQNETFNNPFPMVGEDTRSAVCMEYRRWLYQEITTNKTFANKVKDLHNKSVKCFCSNGMTDRSLGARWCHGHILLACADYLYQQDLDEQLHYANALDGGYFG